VVGCGWAQQAAQSPKLGCSLDPAGTAVVRGQPLPRRPATSALESDADAGRGNPFRLRFLQKAGHPPPKRKPMSRRSWQQRRRRRRIPGKRRTWPRQRCGGCRQGRRRPSWRRPSAPARLPGAAAPTAAAPGRAAGGERSGHTCSTFRLIGWRRSGRRVPGQGLSRPNARQPMQGAPYGTQQCGRALIAIKR
jgi:hypothetical protein